MHIKSAIVEHQKDWVMETHAHPEPELSVVLRGYGYIHRNDTYERLLPGTAVFIPENCAHSFTSNTDIRFAIIHIPHDFLQGLQQAIAVNGPKQSWFLPSPSLLEYEQLFHLWLKALSRKSSPLFLISWIQLLLQSVQQTADVPSLPLTILDAGKYIETHLHQPVKITDLADSAGLSESGFRKKFHSVYGQSPKEFQQLKRLEEAYWRLRATSGTIDEISAVLGFNTVHSFSKWFRKTAGLTASEWRKQQQQL